MSTILILPYYRRPSLPGSISFFKFSYISNGSHTHHSDKNYIKKLSFLVLLILFSSGTAKSQSTYGWNNFFRYVYKNFKIPPEISEDCNFNYAVVVLKTDKQGKIRTVDIANDSKVKAQSLTFLKSYRIGREANLRNRYVLFFLLFDQRKYTTLRCVSPYEIGGGPTQIFTDALRYVSAQLKKDPTTIISYDPIILVMSDPSHKQ